MASGGVFHRRRKVCRSGLLVTRQDQVVRFAVTGLAVVFERLQHLFRMRLAMALGAVGHVTVLVDMAEDTGLG